MGVPPSFMPCIAYFYFCTHIYHYCVINWGLLMKKVFMYDVHTKPNLKWKREGDLFVGYHIESADTFELGNQIPLSIQSLHDDKVLYVCQNCNEWESGFTIAKYAIYFEHPQLEVVFRDWNSYLFYNPISSLKILHRKYNMFSVYENTKHELTETYLVRPTKFVRRIERLT